MALINCPECGKEISDRSDKCIHCGCPLTNTPSPSSIGKSAGQTVINQPSLTRFPQLKPKKTFFSPFFMRKCLITNTTSLKMRCGADLPPWRLKKIWDNISMFLREKKRHKDGKEHRYFSIVENRRVRGNRFVQRQVLYLGEINDSQKAAWCKTLKVFQEGKARPTQMAIFPKNK